MKAVYQHANKQAKQLSIANASKEAEEHGGEKWMKMGGKKVK